MKNKVSLTYTELSDIMSIAKEFPHEDILFDITEKSCGGIGSTIAVEFPYMVGTLNGRYSLVVRGPESW